MTPAVPADHVTPYDRFALDEGSLVALLASRARNEGLFEYFGPELHADLVKLARATHGRKPRGRRVYVLPGIMGSQLGFMRGGHKPNDILWLDPMDIQLGRLPELKLADYSRVVSLGAMNYTYLKLTLSLRKAGFDALLLDYDWRRDTAALGKLLAQRIAADDRKDVAIVGHSMGGLVARAALTHAAGRRVSQIIMLGTPNAGSLGAVQALRGTYSVVRKVAMMDPHHDAEFLAREVFATFPGLHELLPTGAGAGRLDLFDAANWPARGPGPKARMLRRTANLGKRLAPGDARFQAIIGCNRITATGVARRGGDFEYEYSLRGDGTVPIALAGLPGARHRYVDCGHSDLPLSDRVIAGTIDLLKTGTTRRFANKPRIRRAAHVRVRDAELRQEYRGKIDWPHMSPEERRNFLDTLNEPPRRLRPAPAAPRRSSLPRRAPRVTRRRGKPGSAARPRRRPAR
jgi:pimeloyl-ACP methyl ester carboxylesterase